MSICDGPPLGLRQRIRNRWPMVAIWIASVMLALTGISGIFTSLRGREQPITITACTPESWTAPAINEQIRQADCTRPGDAPNDSMDASLPIPVTGQVCNDSELAVAHDVTVAFRGVDEMGAELRVLDVPVTWEPGCRVYDFAFFFPAALIIGEPGDSLGRWRLVGRAIPTLSDTYDQYQWDAMGTIEFLVPETEEGTTP